MPPAMSDGPSSIESRIALGVATLWIGHLRDWVLLRWPVALVADLTVLALATGMSN